jgi:predicted transcriptional regulator
MAMTLRLPEDLDRELDRLAAESHTSKSALMVEAARQLIQRNRREALIEQGFQFALSHDREALQRLADA